jgi:hypothetical protein
VLGVAGVVHQRLADHDEHALYEVGDGLAVGPVADLAFGDLDQGGAVAWAVDEALVHDAHVVVPALGGAVHPFGDVQRGARFAQERDVLEPIDVLQRAERVDADLPDAGRRHRRRAERTVVGTARPDGVDQVVEALLDRFEDRGPADAPRHRWSPLAAGAQPAAECRQHQLVGIHR